MVCYIGANRAQHNQRPIQLYYKLTDYLNYIYNCGPAEFKNKTVDLNTLFWLS